MDGALEAHRRYLAAMREACAHHPVSHSHQLAALDREISLAAAAADASSYRASSGELFELTRAGWLDRAANQARVGAAVGDPWHGEAGAAEHAAALQATGPGDWVEHLETGGARAAALLGRGIEAKAAFTRLLVCLLRLRSVARELEREEWRVHAVSAYRTLREADPGFAWSHLDRLQPYLLRTPWTGPGRDLVGAWIEEIAGGGDEPGLHAVRGDPLAEIEGGEAHWRAELEHRPPSPAPPEEPSLDDAIAPYRRIAEAYPGDDPVSLASRRAADALIEAGAGAPTAEDALAGFVADGLLASFAAAPVRARAEQGLARLSAWPDPVVEHHWRALLAALEQARTPTEVELVSVHSDACLAVEAGWNAVLLSGLLAPVHAALTYGWDRSEEARRGVFQAADAAQGLAGLGPRGLLGLPRVADFVARILVPLAPAELGAFGAFEGEAGFEVLGEARTWIAFLRARGEREPSDEPDMRAALLGFLDRSGVPEPDPAPRPVSLWGTTVALQDLTPGRPAVPGMEAVSPPAPTL